MLILARTRLKRPDRDTPSSFLALAELVAASIRRRARHQGRRERRRPRSRPARHRGTRELLERAGVSLAVAHVAATTSPPHSRLLATGESLAHLDTANRSRRGAANRSPPTPTSAASASWRHSRRRRHRRHRTRRRRRAGRRRARPGGGDWTPTDYDALAGSVIAGHVIECGAQATGGNFSGFRAIERLDRRAFPSPRSRRRQLGDHEAPRHRRRSHRRHRDRTTALRDRAARLPQPRRGHAPRQSARSSPRTATTASGSDGVAARRRPRHESRDDIVRCVAQLVDRRAHGARHRRQGRPRRVGDPRLRRIRRWHRRHHCPAHRSSPR